MQIEHEELSRAIESEAAARSEAVRLREESLEELKLIQKKQHDMEASIREQTREREKASDERDRAADELNAAKQLLAAHQALNSGSGEVVFFFCIFSPSLPLPLCKMELLF